MYRSIMEAATAVDEGAQRRILARAGSALVPSSHGSGTFSVVNPALEAILSRVLGAEDLEALKDELDFGVDDFLEIDPPQRGVRAAAGVDEYTEPSSPYVKVLGHPNAAVFAEAVKLSRFFLASMMVVSERRGATEDMASAETPMAYLLGDTPVRLRQLVFDMYRGVLARLAIQSAVRRGAPLHEWKATALVDAFKRGIEDPVMRLGAEIENGGEDADEEEVRTPVGVPVATLSDWAQRAHRSGPFSPFGDDFSDNG